MKPPYNKVLQHIVQSRVLVGHSCPTYGGYVKKGRSDGKSNDRSADQLGAYARAHQCLDIFHASLSRNAEGSTRVHVAGKGLRHRAFG